jgi:tetratricopeptide (TPR) repeat protein
MQLVRRLKILMLIRLSFLFCFLSFLFAPISPGQAQVPLYISGTVYYADTRQPANEVVVSLLNREHESLITYTTDATGNFRFNSIKPEQYIIAIQVDGYEPVNMNIDLTFTSGSAIPIYLRPLVNKALPAAPSPQGPVVSAHELAMPVKARDLLDAGKKKLYQDKDAKGALVDFQQAFSGAPGYYEAVYQIGVAQLTLGNTTDAEASFRKAIDISADTYPDADIRLGGILLDKKNYPEAEKYLRKGIKAEPNAWLGHYDLGRLLFAQNQLPEALASANEAKRLAPNTPNVYRLLSIIHLQQKDYQALIADLDSYIALDPNSPTGLRAKQLRDQYQQQQSPTAPKLTTP